MTVQELKDLLEKYPDHMTVMLDVDDDSELMHIDSVGSGGRGGCVALFGSDL